MKVLFMTNIPSPYRVDFFNALGKKCDLTVLFERQSAKNRDAAWQKTDIQSFHAVFMKGISVGEAEAFCPEVLRYLSKKKFDVIVVGMYSSPTGMLAIEYMRLRRIPFVLNSDGGIIKDESAFKHNFKRHFISAASGWLSTGQMTSDYLKHYGANAEHIYVYPFTSVNQSEVLARPLTAPEKAAYRQALDMPEEKIVLSVGQFIPRKGYDILLKACETLPKNIGVYIVGGEPTEEYLNLQREMNLTNVHFIGFKKKDDLANYYKAADLFVLPTREDIWGLVINEAMAYGLPVITTDKCVAGVEMLQDGETGYIVPVEQPEHLRTAMESAFALSGEAVLATAQKYSIENMAEEHIKAFEKVLDKSLMV